MSGCVKAICATTSPRCRRPRTAPAVTAESRNALANPRRVAWRAGDSPNRTPTVRATPKVNAVTGTVIPTSNGIPGTKVVTVRSTSQTAPSAAAPDATPSRALSVSS